MCFISLHAQVLYLLHFMYAALEVENVAEVKR